MATFESDLLDENPYGIVATSRALSHAWSGEVEMRQGISTKKPVMQAWFRRGEIDPATNERTPVAEVYTVRFARTSRALTPRAARPSSPPSAKRGSTRASRGTPSRAR